MSENKTKFFDSAENSRKYLLNGLLKGLKTEKATATAKLATKVSCNLKLFHIIIRVKTVPISHSTQSHCHLAAVTGKTGFR